jgi:hypothetical protein
VAQSDNSFGTLIKILVAVWTLFCAYAGCSGFSNVADHVAKDTTGGAAIGATLGMGMILVMWIVPTVGGLVLYLMFGKK